MPNTAGKSSSGGGVRACVADPIPPISSQGNPWPRADMRLGAKLQASALQLRWSFDHLVDIAKLSGFLPAPFQISKRAAGEAAEFRRSGVELLGVIGAARFECGEPAAETGELIGRQLGNRLGDFFDLHAAQYSRSGLGLRALPPVPSGDDVHLEASSILGRLG